MADESRPWLREAPTDPDEVGAVYDGWAGGYDQDLADWGYDAPVVAAQLLATTQAAASPVLDVGCGTGLVGRALREAGFPEVVGVDLSADSLARAEKTGLYQELHQVDFQQVPTSFADDAFEALVCVGVMTYLPDVAATLTEFCRVVTTGGTIVFTQREDIWQQRDCAAVLAALAAEGQCRVIDVTEPREYLPGNESMADVGVIIATLASGGQPLP